MCQGQVRPPQLFEKPHILLRGGMTRSATLDLNRVELRLNSLEEYCVIASILLGAVIGTLVSLRTRASCLRRLMASFQIFTATLLEKKTALGQGDDYAYQQLLEMTSRVRLRGFQSFLLCLTSFNISFLLNMFLNHRGRTRWIILLLGILGTTISLSHFHFIVKMASQIIFR